MRSSAEVGYLVIISISSHTVDGVGIYNLRCSILCQICRRALVHDEFP